MITKLPTSVWIILRIARLECVVLLFARVGSWSALGWTNSDEIPDGSSTSLDAAVSGSKVVVSSWSVMDCDRHSNQEACRISLLVLSEKTYIIELLLAFFNFRPNKIGLSSTPQFHPQIRRLVVYRDRYLKWQRRERFERKIVVRTSFSLLLKSFVFPKRTWNGVLFSVPPTWGTTMISMHPDKVATFKSRAWVTVSYSLVSISVEA